MKKWTEGRININETIEHMTESQKFAFILGIRLTRHSEALAWENMAITASEKAERLDPYKKKKQDNNKKKPTHIYALRRKKEP